MTAIATLPSSSTVRYDEMCRAIQAAYEVDEVKDMRDKALAIEVYAKQAKNVEAERQACEIRLRAERRCGQLTAHIETAQGRRTLSGGPTKSETLDKVGITRDQASQWERLADVPEEDFERAVKADKPTTSGIIAAHAPAREPKKDQVDPKALWLWGRLMDFEREGLLDMEPNTILESMLPHMREATLKMLPVVTAWLKGISDE